MKIVFSQQIFQKIHEKTGSGRGIIPRYRYYAVNSPFKNLKMQITE